MAGMWHHESFWLGTKTTVYPEDPMGSSVVLVYTIYSRI